MMKPKIAITQIGNDAAGDNFVRLICEDSAMLELCNPVVCNEEAVYRKLDEGEVDALVLAPTTGQAKCPAGAVEIIVTDKTNLMTLEKEPAAEDIVKLRNILERDFDLRSPRIAILQETTMQNPELASQITAEQGINTYGPYTLERLLAEDAACHFDGIIIVGDTAMEQRTIQALTQEAPVRFFAGLESVITAVYHPVRLEETEDGLADVSASTHPFYVASDVIRNRAIYDEARQNPLPKLFRDKREDRKAEKETPKNTDKSDNSDKSDLSE